MGARAATVTLFGNPAIRILKSAYLQVQLRILPILPLPRATESRTVKVDIFFGIEGDADVVAGEQVLTFGAEARFAQRPPVLQGIARLEELELSAGSLWQRGHGLGYIFSVARSPSI